MVNKGGSEIKKRLFIFPFETYDPDTYNELVLEPSF